MKKTVLCIFSLVIYLLVFCTFVSQKIEAEMLTEVKVKEIKGSLMWNQDIKLSACVLFREGKTQFFELQEGTGWESSLRVSEIPESIYQVWEELGQEIVSMKGGGDHTFIYSASRVPRNGEQVKIFKKMTTAEDTYLAVYPFGLPEYDKLPNNVTLTAQSDTALLLSMGRAEEPFMEHSVKGGILAPLKDDWQWRVFSLRAAEDFLGQLPLLAVLLLILLIPGILWAVSCILLRRSKTCLLINAAIALILLCCLPFVLWAIDLPASLLPADNILDFGHYSGEFSMILDSLRTLGGAGQHTLNLATQTGAQSILILTGGVLFACGLGAMETILCRRSRKREAER